MVLTGTTCMQMVGPHRHVRHLDELVVHGLRRADQPVQHELTQHDPQVGRVRPVEDALACQPGLDELVERLVAGIQDGARDESASGRWFAGRFAE